MYINILKSKNTIDDKGDIWRIKTSGVDINHPDLKVNIKPGWDFDNDDGDASNNFGPHGTACAGVIAAARNNKGV